MAGVGCVATGERPDDPTARPGRLHAVPLPQPRSPLARAVLPVLGGALLIALIFGFTWGIAAWMSRDGARPSERLAPTTFYVGRVEPMAGRVAEDGPLLFANLDSTTAERTVVLAHEGSDPTQGWRVAWGYPADVGPDCHVDQIEGTDRFTDCNGREIGVDDLAADRSLCPIVEARERLSIGLRASECGVPDTSMPTSTDALG